METQARQLIRAGDGAGIEKLFQEHPELCEVRVNYGRTWLHCAAAQGQPELVRQLSRFGIPLNSTDESGECPLSAAARHGDVELVRWMLDAHADPTISQWPMIDAVSKGSLEIVRLFVERGADHRFIFGDPPRTLLSQAEHFGHREVAEYLRSLNADLPPHQSDAAASGLDDFAFSTTAAQNEAVEAKDLFAMADLILERNLSGIEERLRVLPALLHARSFDMEATWLHYAATEGNMELVHWFFERGLPLNTTNSSDECPLSAVVSECGLEAFEWMLAHGADPRLSQAPMISAVSRGSLERVRRLVELGAEFNFTFGRPPRTPLSQAIDFGHVEVADYLRSLNAVMPDGAEAPDRDLGLADHAPEIDLHEEIKEYFTYQFDTPPLRNGLQEIVPGSVSVSVWTLVPDEGERTIIFTSGMSEKPLTVPEGCEEFRYAEVMMYLPADWPVNPELTDRARSWPWIWLRAIAHYTHERGTWLGDWTTTFANEEPPQPLDPSTQFTGFVLATNFGLEGFRSDDGRFVNIVTAMPVYTEELALAQQEGGTVELLKRFKKYGIGPGLRPGRRNVGARAGLLGNLFRRGKT